ncbi:MAG: CCA tRNA nucleotidyltransferase [Planctomycetes bacterium]|nr:CCA tRNA nucleotidyltransferase [Planctomycetota bacterium]
MKTAGFESYFCGGCVRDSILGKKPQDWDIATAARPEEIEKIFPHTVAVGKAFGVMQVVEDGHSYEVATFRGDSPGGDGRRPDSVHFCSAEEDVLRRDFTVNALLYDPETKEVIDHVGGIEDIKNRIIRSVGAPSKRFLEDYLRILRAVRFSSTLGFNLDEPTFNSVRDMAGLIRLVSAERLGDELEKMLTRGGAGAAIIILEQTHLLLQLLPEVAAMRGVPQPEEFHPEGDVLRHTILMLESLPEACDPLLAWAVLLHDLGKPSTIEMLDRIRFNNHPDVGADMAREILTRLKRPNRMIAAVESLVRDHMRLTHFSKMRVAKQRRLLRDPLFLLHLELHRLDCLASHRKLGIHELVLQAYEEEMARPLPPEPILTGVDLIRLGYTPGPEFSKMLSAIEDGQLEGKFTTPDEAIAYLRQHFPRN